MNKQTGSFKGLSPSAEYLDLCLEFLPRPITTEEECQNATQRLNSILDSCPELTEEQDRYVGLLFLLIQDYEKHQETIPDISDVELLRFLLKEKGLRQKDLVPDVFPTPSIVSEVLNGRRELSKSHIQNLAAFFSVSPAVFL